MADPDLLPITFRCPPEWRARLLPPIPAREVLPDWLKRMPATAHSPTVEAEARTVKRCPPFLDAMGAGWIIPLQCDVIVEGGQMRWDWDLPPTSVGRPSRAPVSLHVGAQLAGAPIAPDGMLVVKFNNCWTVELPPGWSLLCAHPFNREELPFRTLTGIVDCDRFVDGFVQFPALWTDPDFSGTLPRGTPVAQILPVPRQGFAPTLGVIEGEGAARFAELGTALGRETGVYRKRYRAKRPAARGLEE
jgi:hypothetical protein